MTTKSEETTKTETIAKGSDVAETPERAIVEIFHNLKSPKASKTNEYFGTKYSSLSDVLSVLKEATPNYASVNQELAYDPEMKQITVKLMVRTADDTIVLSTVPIIEMKATSKTNPNQMFGQAVTYMRRYQIKSYFGIGDEDEDGNIAGYSEEFQSGNGYQSSHQSSNDSYRKQTNSYGSNKQKPYSKTTSGSKLTGGQLKMIESLFGEIAEIIQKDKDVVERTVLEKYNIDNIDNFDRARASEFITSLKNLKSTYQKRESKESSDSSNVDISSNQNDVHEKNNDSKNDNFSDDDLPF